MAEQPDSRPVPCLPAICYSGYRAGQSPGASSYPTQEQILEDLLLLQRHWRLIRLYDCGPHARRVLEVIRRHGLRLRVLLGAYLEAEVDNPRCPWGGRHAAQVLRDNRLRNEAEVDRLVELARGYPEVVIAGAVGNEACVEWTDHLVQPARVRELLQRARRGLGLPLTVCDNYAAWLGELGSEVGREVDFVSLHTYPVWENKGIEQALDHTQANYQAVAQAFAGKQVVITEAGWPSAANGRGFCASNASEGLQRLYLHALLDWSWRAAVSCFVFEAFDEAWKGSDDPLEPEKHWGIYTESRSPKRFVAGACAPG